MATILITHGIPTAGLEALSGHEIIIPAPLTAYSMDELMVLIPNMGDVWVNVLTALDCVCLLISFAGYLRVYTTRSSMIQELHPSGEEAN